MSTQQFEIDSQHPVDGEDLGLLARIASACWSNRSSFIIVPPGFELLFVQLFKAYSTPIHVRTAR